MLFRKNSTLKKPLLLNNEEKKPSQFQSENTYEFSRLSDFLKERDRINQQEWKKINSCVQFDTKQFFANTLNEIDSYLTEKKKNLKKAPSSNVKSVVEHIENKYSDAIKVGLISTEEYKKALKEINENYSNKYCFLFQGIYGYRKIFAFALLQIKMEPLLKLSAAVDSQKVELKGAMSAFSLPPAFVQKKYELFQQTQQFCEWLNKFSQSRFVEPTVSSTNEMRNMLDRILKPYITHQLANHVVDSRPDSFKISNNKNFLNQQAIYDWMNELESSVKKNLLDKEALSEQEKALIKMINELFALKSEKWSADDIDYDAYSLQELDEIWPKQMNKFDLECKINQILNLPQLQEKEKVFEAYIEFKNFMMIHSKGELGLSDLKKLDIILPHLIPQGEVQSLFNYLASLLKRNYSHYFKSGIFESNGLFAKGLQVLENEIASMTPLNRNLSNFVLSFLEPIVDYDLDVDTPAPKFNI